MNVPYLIEHPSTGLESKNSLNDVLRRRPEVSNTLNSMIFTKQDSDNYVF
jgi:hypothetical protein